MNPTINPTIVDVIKNDELGKVYIIGHDPIEPFPKEMDRYLLQADYFFVESSRVSLQYLIESAHTTKTIFDKANSYDTELVFLEQECNENQAHKGFIVNAGIPERLYDLYSTLRTIPDACVLADVLGIKDIFAAAVYHLNEAEGRQRYEELQILEYGISIKGLVGLSYHVANFFDFVTGYNVIAPALKTVGRLYKGNKGLLTRPGRVKGVVKNFEGEMCPKWKEYVKVIDDTKHKGLLEKCVEKIEKEIFPEEKWMVTPGRWDLN